MDVRPSDINLASGGGSSFHGRGRSGSMNCWRATPARASR